MTRRKPEQYKWASLKFDETLLKKHYTARVSRKIKYVFIHHMTIIGHGTGSANDACYSTWQTRQASAHYGVDGSHVRKFVLNRNVAWATGNSSGNEYGISIEHANSTAANSWKISETTWKNGAKLTAYLHKKYKLGRPVKDVTVRKHSAVRATACPGPFMDAIWDEYVREAQRVYDEITKPKKKVLKSRGAQVDKALAALKKASGTGQRRKDIGAAIKAVEKIEKIK